MEKKEVPQMSLSAYREHCRKAMAIPMVDMIDRIECLSESLKMVLSGPLSDDGHHQVQKTLELYGFEAPIK